MDEKRVRQRVQEELQKLFEEIILPAIQNIVQFEISESKKRMTQKIKSSEERMITRIEESEERLIKRFDSKFDGIYTMLDKLVGEADDKKTEKTMGDYLVGIHTQKK